MHALPLLSATTMPTFRLESSRARCQPGEALPPPFTLNSEGTSPISKPYFSLCPTTV